MNIYINYKLNVHVKEKTDRGFVYNPQPVCVCVCVCSLMFTDRGVWHKIQTAVWIPTHELLHTYARALHCES